MVCSDNNGVIGMVLAGGGSRRMGCDKALLDWHGRPVIDHLTDKLHQAGCSRVVISRATPGCIADYFPDHGPLGGMHAVVHDCPADGYLVVPVDMPLIRVSLLRHLIASGLRDGHCYYRRSPLPCYLSGSDGAALEALLRQRLQRRTLALAGLLNALGARAMKGGEDQDFLNTNTPEAWRAARALSPLGEEPLKETGS